MGFPIKTYRPASFIAPSGDEFDFLTNTLERSGGKKGATQEILDSDESIPQDQGNKATTFPFNIYFPGANFDEKADPFYKALEERYSQEKPGKLKHPRWGDIDVFPFEWSQREELISGAMISRIEVTFREVFPKVFPSTDIKSIDKALANIDEMENVSVGFIKKINLDSIIGQANVIGKIRGVVGIVSSSIKAVTGVVQAVQDQFNSIQNEINAVLDDVTGIGENIGGLMTATQKLIRTPARIFDQTLDKVNSFSGMADSLSNQFLDFNETSELNRRNNAIMMQLIAGFAVCATAEAAIFTDFSVRSEAIAAIDKINESLILYDTNFAQARTDGNVAKEYSGDHNYYSLLFDTITLVNDSILNEAFDLKVEKSFILKTNSDIINLCYNGYGSVDNETLDFFISTNKFAGDEFIEIPAGREIKLYV